MTQELQAKKRMQEESLKKQEEMIQRQEQMRRSTLEHEAQLREKVLPTTFVICVRKNELVLCSAEESG